MESRKFVFRQTGILAAGQALCTAAMIGVFALIGKFDTSVLLGGIVGGLIATANFFFMSLFATLAADKAEAQDVAGGQKLIQLSYMGRMLGLFLILFLCAKSGLFHVLALAIPLVFTRPILTVSELFKKKGGNAA
jgi:hypothetical protein